MIIDRKSKSAGFSLIELMITVAVVAILATIAYPSYLDTIRKGKRGDAKAALLEVAQKQEVFYARNAIYSLDMRELGYTNRNYNNITGGNGSVSYQIDTLGAVGSCPIATCYRLQVRPRAGTDQVNDDGVSGPIRWYRLWSTGRKQYRTGSSTRNGWG